MIGRIIGNYQVTGELAQGGMGTVYRGHHLHLPREVVVKAILLGSFSSSAQVHLKARFRREAYIQSQLDHPNIVRVYEFFAAEDNYYLVMEYVPGMSLRDLLAKQGVPTPEQVVYLCKQALTALDYAHKFSYVDESDIRHVGVIHRDIKPANLLLDPKGKLKITDFGIVKVLGEPGTSAMTQSGFHPGTVEYMSPEQLMGLEIDVRSDLYSLGVTFYELLTGRLPFPRSSNGSDWEVRKGHIELEPPPVLNLRPDAPPALAAIITRSLQKNPNERFQTAAEFLEMLQHYEQRYNSEQTARIPSARLTRANVGVPTLLDQTSSSVSSNPASTPWEEMATLPLTQSRASAPVAATPPSGELPTLVRTPASRRHLPLIVAGAGLLLVGAVSGAFFFSSPAGKGEPQAAVAKMDIPTATPAPTVATPTPIAVVQPTAKPKPSPVVRPSATINPTPTAPAAVEPPAPPAPAEDNPQAQLAALLSETKALEDREQYPNSPTAQMVNERIITRTRFLRGLTAAQGDMEAARYRAARQKYNLLLKMNPNSKLAQSGLAEAQAKLDSNPMNPEPPRQFPPGRPRRGQRIPPAYNDPPPTEKPPL
jgi:eukaryotic-like serine/threonine-protein kinase